MWSTKNILSTILVAGIFALHPSLNKGEGPIPYLQYFVYGNELNISTNSTIDKNQLEVKWTSSSNTNSYNDLIIFKNGKQVNEIPAVMGDQKLIVFYDNNKIGEIPQHKNSEKQAHDYNIELLSKNGSLFFSGEIIGPSPYKGPPTTILSVASL